MKTAAAQDLNYPGKKYPDMAGTQQLLLVPKTCKTTLKHSPVVHLHELVLGHVEAVPELTSSLERLLEVVHELGRGAARSRLLALFVVFVLPSNQRM